MSKNSNSFSAFMSERYREKRAKKGLSYKITNKDIQEERDFIKNVLPLMSISDLVGCIIMKSTLDSEGAIYKGLYFHGQEYEVEVRKVNSEVENG